MSTSKTAGSRFKSANVCYKIGAKPIFCVFFEIPNFCVYVEKINLGRWPNRDNYLYQTVNNPFHNNYDDTICHWIKIMKEARIVHVELQELKQDESINSWHDLAKIWKVSDDAAKEIIKVCDNDFYNQICRKEMELRLVPRFQLNFSEIPILI